MPALGVPTIVSTIYAGVHDAAAKLPNVGHTVVAGLATVWPIVTEELHAALGSDRVSALEAEALDVARGVVVTRLNRLPHGGTLVHILDAHIWPLVEAEARKLVDAAPGAGAA
jgi:hypothetical protein